MSREIKNWHDSSQVTREDFYVLAPRGEDASAHNVFVEDHGYLMDHVPSERRRDNPDYWNKMFENAKAFERSWPPRSGPLELVYNLASQESGIFYVVNAGAGTGAFTANLSLIPNTHTTHVDFSHTANTAAKKNVSQYGNPDQVDIITAENREFLQQLILEGQTADFVFIYGGLGENTPLEADIEETLVMAANVLKPGGHLWYVGLEQPFLEGEGKRTVTLQNREELLVSDILGEVPTKPGFIRDSVLNNEVMYVVKDTTGPRPDSHPLRPGGPSEKHAHVVYRGLFAKLMLNGQRVQTPEFDFKNAVNPDWESTWRQLKQQ